MGGVVVSEGGGEGSGGWWSLKVVVLVMSAWVADGCGVGGREVSMVVGSGEDDDGVVEEMMVVWRLWPEFGRSKGRRRKRWRRVAASGYGDRVDRVMRITFGFGRNARRKTFSAAAAAWWPVPAAGGKWWPDIWGRWRRERGL
ncbi:hypothetical protein Tco_0938845 [Tanacetum coccineum]|uniref:Secreted protein n=1 Tax=Tanacetum coccineum TaxID=301880 RepID=A0ABQ5DIZ2_9ASTR